MIDLTSKPPLISLERKVVFGPVADDKIRVR
jgi:hypothetical protein